MDNPSRVRVTGPLACHRNGLHAELRSQGYVAGSACRLLRVLADLSRWMAVRGIRPEALVTGQVERFLRHRRKLHARHFSRRGLQPVLRYLRTVGAVPVSRAIPLEQSPLEQLLAQYVLYLARERALVPSTLRRYEEVARRFLRARFHSDTPEPGCLAAVDVASYVLRESRVSSVGYAKNKITALRSFLRYLHVRGDLPVDLARAVPSVAGWRLAGLPKYLAAGEVRRILRSCDRRTRVGRRDVATLLLMVRLGLRACEVAALGLNDVRWHVGELIIRGKGRREDVLPLPPDVGEAIVSYLRRGRPRSPCRHLFLGARAPHLDLSSEAVKGIVRSAGIRSGVPSRGEHLGSHRLRHTAATQMLRGGASLSQIAQVLRHRSPDTTAIYAKVDRDALRDLGRPWPGGRP